MTAAQIRAALGEIANVIRSDAFTDEVRNNPNAYNDNLIAHAGAYGLMRATDAQLERLGRLLK